MLLRECDGWAELAKLAPFGQTTLRTLGSHDLPFTDKHLRPIAAALDVPFSWFETEDVFVAVERYEEGPSRDERLEAVERQVAALIAQLSQRPDPPVPPDELLRPPRGGGPT